MSGWALGVCRCCKRFDLFCPPPAVTHTPTRPALLSICPNRPAETASRGADRCHLAPVQKHTTAMRLLKSFLGFFALQGRYTNTTVCFIIRPFGANVKKSQLNEKILLECGSSGVGTVNSLNIQIS